MWEGRFDVKHLPFLHLGAGVSGDGVEEGDSGGEFIVHSAAGTGRVDETKGGEIGLLLLKATLRG